MLANLNQYYSFEMKAVKPIIIVLIPNLYV